MVGPETPTERLAYAFLHLLASAQTIRLSTVAAHVLTYVDDIRSLHLKAIGPALIPFLGKVFSLIVAIRKIRHGAPIDQTHDIDAVLDRFIVASAHPINPPAMSHLGSKKKPRIFALLWTCRTHSVSNAASQSKF